VHAHSSLAGVVVRLWMLGRPRVPVIYSPHCFAFERRDVSGLRRAVYRMTETVLARLTAGFVCVSPHEAALARALRRRAVVRYVANYFEPGPAATAPGATPGEDGVLRLVSVGRISPQKDPAMFAEVVRSLNGTGTRTEACWVGDGDDEGARQALVGAGVRITGWLPARRVPEILATHSLYVHTATWEALPIAVMEAMRVGLVVLVRHNEAYTDLLPAAWQFHDLPEALRMIDEFRDPARHRERLDDQARVLTGLRARGPDAALADAYRDIYAAWWSTARRPPRRHELPS
jgi:glycosyltransferase involved in cell wall biosynthesis